MVACAWIALVHSIIKVTLPSTYSYSKPRLAQASPIAITAAAKRSWLALAVLGSGTLTMPRLRKNGAAPTGQHSVKN